jgi:hypothetical protein
MLGTTTSSNSASPTHMPSKPTLKSWGGSGMTRTVWRQWIWMLSWYQLCIAHWRFLHANITCILEMTYKWLFALPIGDLCMQTLHAFWRWHTNGYLHYDFTYSRLETTLILPKWDYGNWIMKEFTMQVWVGRPTTLKMNHEVIYSNYIDITH